MATKKAVAMTPREYKVATTPPRRYLRCLDGVFTVCLKKHCGLPMRPDLNAWDKTVHELLLWKKRQVCAPDGQLIRSPLSLYRILLSCHNGHTEVWAAEIVPLLPMSPPASDDGRVRPNGTRDLLPLGAEERRAQRQFFIGMVGSHASTPRPPSP